MFALIFAVSSAFQFNRRYYTYYKRIINTVSADETEL